MDVRNLFMADAEPQEPSAPRGGLAPTMVGGLSKFVGNVTKGIEKVMSHPLYARAWSGAVSGMAGDPMAGPRALAELRAQNAPSLEDELNRYRLRKAQRDEEQAVREAEANDRLRQSLMSGDQRSVDSAFADAYPQQAAERLLAPPKAPNLKPIMTDDGPRYVTAEEAVGQTPFSPSLVEINNGPGGLDMNQIATASRAERQAFLAAMVPFESFDRARSTMRNVRNMADERGVLPQQASQIIASDAMAALRPEALNEGDVARLTAVGLWNKINAAIGLPPQMTVEQLDTLARMIEDKAREAEPKRQALIEDGRFRAQQFGFDPRLILGDYATQGQRPTQPTPAAPPSTGNVLSPERARALGLE